MCEGLIIVLPATLNCCLHNMELRFPLSSSPFYLQLLIRDKNNKTNNNNISNNKTNNNYNNGKIPLYCMRSDSWIDMMRDKISLLMFLQSNAWLLIGWTLMRPARIIPVASLAHQLTSPLEQNIMQRNKEKRRGNNRMGRGSHSLMSFRVNLLF